MSAITAEPSSRELPVNVGEVHAFVDKVWPKDCTSGLGERVRDLLRIVLPQHVGDMSGDDAGTAEILLEQALWAVRHAQLVATNQRKSYIKPRRARRSKLAPVIPLRSSGGKP